MFERFTDGARRVVVLAQEESRERDDRYIGTEHLLLALLQEQPSEPELAQALNAAGLTVQLCRAQIDRSGKRVVPDVPPGHVPFSPNAKKSLELSLRSALELNHNVITMAHLFLGLVRMPQSTAARVLSDLGADLAALERTAIQVANQVCMRTLTHGQEQAGPGGTSAATLTRIRFLEALQQRYREALRRYGRHEDGCVPETGCTCGLGPLLGDG